MTFSIPEPLTLPHAALSIASHASQTVLAVGLTTGGLLTCNITDSSSPTVVPVDTSIPAVEFLEDSVLAGSKRSVLLFDTAREKEIASFRLAKPDSEEGTSESSAVSCIYAHSESLFLAGDDDGAIHFFDKRAPKCVSSILEQADYISSMQYISHAGTDALLASSGDGTLCAYDLRLTPKPQLCLQYATDTYNDDLLSMARVKHLMVTGTLSGALNLYNLAFMDKQREADAVEHVDRFYGHPECVNAILAYDDAVITASSDGLIRVVDVIQKRLIGVLEYDMAVIGEKRKREAWPIEGMVSVRGVQKPLFALQSHDEYIRFCDGAPLVDDDEQPGDEEKKVIIEEPQEEGRKPKRKRGKRKKQFKPTKKSADFFNDL